MKYLAVLPGALIGALAGTGIAVISGLMSTILWYGSQAYQHTEITAACMRPGAIVGMCIGIVVAIAAVQ